MWIDTQGRGGHGGEYGLLKMYPLDHVPRHGAFLGNKTCLARHGLALMVASALPRLTKSRGPVPRAI